MSSVAFTLLTLSPFYALDMRLDLAAGATKDQLLVAMRGHVLAEAQIM